MKSVCIIAILTICSVLTVIGCGEAPQQANTTEPAQAVPPVQEETVVVEPLSFEFIEFRAHGERGRIAAFSFTNTTDRAIARVDLKIELLDAEAQLMADPPPDFFFSGDPHWLAAGQTIEAEVGENLPEAAMSANLTIVKILHVLDGTTDTSAED